MKTPDVTPAQITALTAALLNVAASFGLNLDADQTKSIRDLLDIALVLVLADGGIRLGRNIHAAAQLRNPADSAVVSDDDTIADGEGEEI